MDCTDLKNKNIVITGIIKILTSDIAVLSFLIGSLNVSYQFIYGMTLIIIVETDCINCCKLASISKCPSIQNLMKI